MKTIFWIGIYLIIGRLYYIYWMNEEGLEQGHVTLKSMAVFFWPAIMIYKLITSESAILFLTKLGRWIP